MGKTWTPPVLVSDVLPVGNAREMAAFRLSLAAADLDPRDSLPRCPPKASRIGSSHALRRCGRPSPTPSSSPRRSGGAGPASRRRCTSGRPSPETAIPGPRPAVTSRPPQLMRGIGALLGRARDRMVAADRDRERQRAALTGGRRRRDELVKTIYGRVVWARDLFEERVGRRRTTSYLEVKGETPRDPAAGAAAAGPLPRPGRRRPRPRPRRRPDARGDPRPRPPVAGRVPAPGGRSGRP